MPLTRTLPCLIELAQSGLDLAHQHISSVHELVAPFDPGGLLDPNARRIAELAAQSRLPTMYAFRFYVESGGLISYGADLIENNRRVAVFVDKILKGAKPADLPV